MTKTNQRRRVLLPVILAVPLLTAGCNTYLNQKADLRAGGPQMRQAAAQQRLTDAQRQQDDLNDQNTSMQRDIERNERRLASAEKDVAGVNRNLDEARRQRRISEASYTRLKQESEKLQQDINEIDLKMKSGNTDSPADLKAKEQELQALEKKKSELEKALKLAYTR